MLGFAQETFRLRTDIMEMPTEDIDMEESLYSVTEDDPSDQDWTPDIFNESYVRDGNPAKERKFIGSFLAVKALCECGEFLSWNSQPLSGTLPLGNLLTAAAILFAGCHPSQVLTMFQHASVQMICQRTYNNLQTLYLVPAISSVYQFKQLNLFEEIKETGVALRLGGDARCCSPRHTAKYGSYSLIDLTKAKILDIQLVQSNEVKNSYSMELEGLKCCLAFLMENNLKLFHLIIDRHSQVKAYMAKEHPEVTHWFDCWHVAKGIYKKLEAAGKRRSCKNLSDWARSISNHLYWCAASSEGDGDLVHDKWISILNHVTNIQEGHEGKYQSCQHGQLANRKWIKRDSKAFLELEKVIKGRLLVKDVKNKSPAEQTSGLEAFHRVVCHFAPKLVHFFHAQMEARSVLAKLFLLKKQLLKCLWVKNVYLFLSEYESCVNSVQTIPIQEQLFNFKEVNVIDKKGYVEDLMEELLLHREVQNSFSKAFNYLRWDKKRPVPLSQSTPHRPKADIIRDQIRRFNR
ncbi:hypothetical protein KUTeg_011260 [Tegillarca granosa]|uniref:Transposase n=1 Tax=Tegillarca granosa TaxID=220873 RepID=A0ABQ9F1C2_TEGGR|nr:hypothetical protein KUTeg_011260 [Tegillarca granosa]